MTQYNAKGKIFRIYYQGSILVSNDGTTVFQRGKKEKIFGKKLAVKTDYLGKFVIDQYGQRINIADAVMACFCPPRPDNKKNYVIGYKDGNKNNCHRYNLQWVEYHSSYNTDNSACYYHNGTVLTIKSDGTVFEGKKQLTITDCLYDSDIDLFNCINPYCTIKREHLFIESLMKKMGYVNGDEANFQDPVILHRDNNFMNNASCNLEWVEKSDQRYVDYIKQRDIDIHDRRVALNPGKQLYPGW